MDTEKVLFWDKIPNWGKIVIEAPNREVEVQFISDGWAVTMNVDDKGIHLDVIESWAGESEFRCHQFRVDSDPDLPR